jgi:ferredoxin-NADP reductase
MAVAQKLACRVERITSHGEHVYTVELSAERTAPKFRPGQFLHLALDAYDPSGFWPESRVFSIASPPTQREQLRITYSVQGRYTARMEKELAEGRRVWVKLPYGEFIVEDASDVVLFAGGTGITAFTAFLEGLTHKFQHAVYLAYGARQRSLLIYRDMVEQRAQKTSVLHTFYFIESKVGELQPNETSGRLSAAAIWPQIQDPLQATFYLSGPPAMLKAISLDLRGRGIRADAIRIDAWE